MRSVFLSFIISLIFLGLFIYLADNLPIFYEDQIPIIQEQFAIQTNEEFILLFNDLKKRGLLIEIVNKNNVYVTLSMLFLFILSTISTLHLLIDKLFFKKFYQQPDIFPAIRRAFWFAIIVIMIIFMYFWAFINYWTTFMTFLSFGLIEYVLTKVLNRKINTQSDSHAKT